MPRRRQTQARARPGDLTGEVRDLAWWWSNRTLRDGDPDDPETLVAHERIPDDIFHRLAVVFDANRDHLLERHRARPHLLTPAWWVAVFDHDTEVRLVALKTGIAIAVADRFHRDARLLLEGRDTVLDDVGRRLLRLAR